MLEGVNPILTGELLLRLDRLGHSDSVVISDAHFPAYRFGVPVLELPALRSPEVLRAIRSVTPLDDAPALVLMATPDSRPLPIHQELAEAARAESADLRMAERNRFYELASEAQFIVRTGEVLVYANARLQKGVVGH
jgi:L-fucose mutarotase